MIIKKLKLHNIRSYVSHEINFPEGIVMLSGDIGAGKSSILLAIEFALFGFNRKTLTGETLLRHGRHDGSVELEFLLKKHNADNINPYHHIIIKRNLRRTNQVKQESGYIIIDGVKIECTPVELKTRVLELLGYPQEMVTRTRDVIFRYTVYTPQEQMKQILLDEKEYRLETLRKVFNIDKYKRIRENSAVIIREMKNKKAELLGMTSDIEEKKKTKAAKEEQIKLINAQLSELIHKHEHLNTQIKTISETLEMLERKLEKVTETKNKIIIEKNRLETLTQQKKNNYGRISLLQEQIAELNRKIETFKIKKPEEANKELIKEEIEKCENEIFGIREKRIKLAKEVEFNNRQIENISSEIKERKDFTKDYVKKKMQLDELEKEIYTKPSLIKEINKLDAEIKELSLEIKENDVKINASRSLKDKIISMDKCPTCLQEIDTQHKAHISLTEDKIILKCREFLEDIEKEKQEKVTEKNEKEQILERIREKEKQFEKLKAEFGTIERYNNELMKKQKILEEMIKQRNKFNEEKNTIDNINIDTLLSRLKNRKEMLDVLNQYEEKQKQKQLLLETTEEKKKELVLLDEEVKKLAENIDIASHNLSLLGRELEESRGIEEKYIPLKRNLQETQAKEREIALSKGKLEQESAIIGNIIGDLEKEIAQKAEYQKTIEKINSFVNWIEELFGNLMLVMEKHIMHRLHQEFNELFIEWFNILMEDENLGVRLDDEFTPLIEQNGYETGIENLSGGERSAVALAYRLALNKVINTFMTQINTKDIIILDEPTDGFSQEQLDKMKDVFDELNIRQVILVSHETKMESFAEHVLRIAKSGHVSCVV